MEFKLKERYDVADLRAIMQLLRAPEGCPWDREQTHVSIASNMLEEAYEAVDAIEHDDSAELCEELGDVLLQVVFHAQMAAEDEAFNFDDVADGICQKLIVRHPHVFAAEKAENAEAVLKNWDAIKRAAKGDKPQSAIMQGLPAVMPALMRAEKVRGRAGRVGFDHETAEQARADLDAEMVALDVAMDSGNTGAIEDELGDVLFATVNVARRLGVEPERALRRAVDRFICRFAQMEQLAAQRGVAITEKGLWEAAKSIEPLDHK